MQRKQQREVQEIMAAMPLPSQVPALPEIGTTPLPSPELPPLPLPGELPMPLPGELPPLPLPGTAPLPELKREAKCPECQATFSVKDLMLKRVSCPICSASFNL